MLSPSFQSSSLALFLFFFALVQPLLIDTNDNNNRFSSSTFENPLALGFTTSLCLDWRGDGTLHSKGLVDGVGGVSGLLGGFSSEVKSLAQLPKFR